MTMPLFTLSKKGLGYNGARDLVKGPTKFSDSGIRADHVERKAVEKIAMVTNEKPPLGAEQCSR